MGSFEFCIPRRFAAGRIKHTCIGKRGCLLYTSYAEPVPSTFRMKADVTQADGMLLVDGYACIEGERFEHIDTFVALYPGTGGTALRLPTKMVLSEEAYEAGGRLALSLIHI